MEHIQQTLKSIDTIKISQFYGLAKMQAATFGNAKKREKAGKSPTVTMLNTIKKAVNLYYDMFADLQESPSDDFIKKASKYLHIKKLNTKGKIDAYAEIVVEELDELETYIDSKIEALQAEQPETKVVKEIEVTEIREQPVSKEKPKAVKTDKTPVIEKPEPEQLAKTPEPKKSGADRFQNLTYVKDKKFTPIKNKEAKETISQPTKKPVEHSNRMARFLAKEQSELLLPKN